MTTGSVAPNERNHTNTIDHITLFFEDLVSWCPRTIVMYLQIINYLLRSLNIR